MGILQQIIELNLIRGDVIDCDGTCLPIQASSKNLADQEVVIRKEMKSYLELLNQELEKHPGFQVHESSAGTKTAKMIHTVPKARWITHGQRVCLGCLM